VVASQRAIKDSSPVVVDTPRETQISQPATYRNEAQVKTVSATSAGANLRVDEPAGTKSKTASTPSQASAQPSPRAWGAYELVRSAQVYSEPTESSQLVAKLESGTQVNVVSARDGWLEIRSKNGRPPGFIKSDAAARVTQ
jgi:hypothetical protein